MNKKKGFSLIEVLISLQVMIFCSLMFYTAVRMIHSFALTSYQHEDEMAIYQMQHILALSQDIEIKEAGLHIKYLDKDMSFTLINHHLVLQEGYQRFLQDIESVYFYKKEHCLWIRWRREGDSYQKANIYCE